MGVWAAPGAPFVALEPWTGTTTLDTEDDVLEHKHDITILEPGGVSSVPSTSRCCRAAPPRAAQKSDLGEAVRFWRAAFAMPASPLMAILQDRGTAACPFSRSGYD